MSPAATMPRARLEWTLNGPTVIALIIGLLANAVAIGSIYGNLNQRLISVEEKVREVGAAPETVARLDERTKAMQEQLTDIKSQLARK